MYQSNTKLDHENLVAKWLQNSFKIQENTALDLRATPLSLQIPQMTTEVQQQTARSVFKMNADFWNQARGPPSSNNQNIAQNLSSGSNQNSPVPSNSQNNTPNNNASQMSPSAQSNGSQNQIITPGALALQQAQQQAQAAQQAQQQQQQQAQAQAQQVQQAQAQAVQAAAQAQAQAQQNQIAVPQPSPGQNSPEKMITDKIVSELQVSKKLLFYFLV